MYSQLEYSSTLSAINQQQNEMQQENSRLPFNGETGNTKSSGEKVGKNESNSTKGGGINIFNVDFLKIKNRKEKKSEAETTPAENATEKGGKMSKGKKSKQTNGKNEISSFNTALNQTSINLNSSNSKELSLINFDESNEHQKTNHNQIQLLESKEHEKSNEMQQQQTGSSNLLDASPQKTSQSTTTSLGSNKTRNMAKVSTSSLLFDLLEKLNISTSSNKTVVNAATDNVDSTRLDVDSDGYSIRPTDASSIDLRGQTNFNASSLSSSAGGGRLSSEDSDSDVDKSIGPVKVMLKIKPKSDVAEEVKKDNTEVLKEISKSLQLKLQSSRNSRNRSYYDSSAVSSVSRQRYCATPIPTSEHLIMNQTTSHHIMRSISAGSVVANKNISKFNFSMNSTTSSQTSVSIEQSITSTVVSNNLYNIDEDKEVENTFNPTFQTENSSTDTGEQSASNINVNNASNIVHDVNVTCSIDPRSQNFNASSLSSVDGRVSRNKDNHHDMSNFYNHTSTTSNSDESDSDGDDSIGPVKVMLKIKPKSDVAEEVTKDNTEVLKEISKSLQLKLPNSQQSNGTNTVGQNARNRSYYYNYGGSSAASAATRYRNSATPIPTSEHLITNQTTSHHIMRSISAGSVVANKNISKFNFSMNSTTSSQASVSITSTAVSNNLYNIDEDKEIENSSTETGSKSTSNINTNNCVYGRFTPASRKTPDLPHICEQPEPRDSIDSSQKLKVDNDVDSDGYSIRPADVLSLDLRRSRKKDKDDMSYFYNSTATSSTSSDESDSDSIGPVKVMLKIKPKNEMTEDVKNDNTEVLKEISKRLQLKLLSQQSSSTQIVRNARNRLNCA